MLTTVQMQEIQDLKLQGYTKSEIPAYYEAQGKKPPSMPTIRKYYDMDVLPEKPGINLQKDKVFDHDPFRPVIIEVLRNNAGNKHLCISSVYDVLEERFIENGDYTELPGNQQTLRNYVHYLRANGIVESEPKNTRIYEYVFDTPPGEQMLIDFGQQKIENGHEVHFICLLLRYSRYLLVYAQDHKFNAEEACRAIYRSFCKLGGRIKQLVIDQDAVFVASETYGEVIKTRVFEDFCREQDLTLFVCRKSDPESKGPIENAVGFVKKNFFSARTLADIDAVWKSLPGWLERKNRRIHQTTFCVPVEIFGTFEKPALAPLLPSVYENSPASYTRVKLSGMPYIQYRTCKYSVPRDLCFQSVYYKVAGGKLHIYDENRRYIYSHAVSECKGRTIQAEEHKKQPSTEWIAVAERMRLRWNCVDFQHFINGFKKENPRYLYDQLTQVEKYLLQKNPERPFVATVMAECCRKFRYRYSQFKVVYDLMEKGQLSDNAYTVTDVQKQDLAVYTKAFNDRCAV